MNREYWIDQIMGKLYAVKYSNGNYSVTVFEGDYSECEKWISNN